MYLGQLVRCTAASEVCLFIDGDIVISAENLRPYLEAADQGIDVALNNLECLLDEVHPIHSVSLCRNIFLILFANVLI